MVCVLTTLCPALCWRQCQHLESLLWRKPAIYSLWEKNCSSCENHGAKNRAVLGVCPCSLEGTCSLQLCETDVGRWGWAAPAMGASSTARQGLGRKHTWQGKHQLSLTPAENAAVKIKKTPVKIKKTPSECWSGVASRRCHVSFKTKHLQTQYDIAYQHIWHLPLANYSTESSVKSFQLVLSCMH